VPRLPSRHDPMMLAEERLSVCARPLSMVMTSVWHLGSYVGA